MTTLTCRWNGDGRLRRTRLLSVKCRTPESMSNESPGAMRPRFFPPLLLSAALVLLLTPPHARAEVSETRIEYEADGVKLVGYLYAEQASARRSPAVLVFSDWMGLGRFPKEKAKELAKAGYPAFAADVYGGGMLAKDQKEAAG